MPKGSTYGMTQIWTADKQGDEFQGLIRVPDALCHSKPFTDNRRKFNEIVESNIKKWVAWRLDQGWKLNSKPKVTGPFDPPSKDEKSAPVDQGVKWYFVTAYFVREYPLFLPTDAALWYRDEFEKHGLDPMAKGRSNSNSVKTSKKITNPEFVNPLKVAEERRKRLGKDHWTQKEIGPSEGENLQVM